MTEPRHQMRLVVIAKERDKGWRGRVGYAGGDFGQYHLGDERQIEMTGAVQGHPLEIRQLVLGP